MKLNANHVSLAISLSLALSSGTAFALPVSTDGDAGTARYVERQVTDPLQLGTGGRGVHDLAAMPVEASLLNGPTRRFDDLKRSTSTAQSKPPVWVHMDPEREELGPGEAPRPKKPRRAKKTAAHSEKKKSGKPSKKSAKESRLERKLLQHQRALDEQKFASKGSKAGKPTKTGHQGLSKSSHSKSQKAPPGKGDRKPPGNGDHKPSGKGERKPPGPFSADPLAGNRVQSLRLTDSSFANEKAVQRSLDEIQQAFERDEQDDQTEKAGQGTEQGEPKDNEVDQSKAPHPTLASMLLPIKRSLWSNPFDDLTVYDRDIDEAVEDARDDDAGNAFWDRDIDNIASRDIGPSDEELEEARELLTDLDSFEDARDTISAELFAAHPPTIGKREELDEAIASAWARAAVEDDIVARNWRLAAQKAIDCSVDPAGCAIKYGMSYTGLEPSEGQKATFDRLRAASQKARDCGSNPAGCAMDHGLKYVGLEPPPGRR